MTLQLTTIPDKPRTAIMRTSDSILFKRCRRQWNWNSHLRDNLGPLQHANPLWLGSAMHFALEDFHGHNLYGSPSIAIQAFAYAFEQKYPHKIPDDWVELLKLGRDMMEYYLVWLSNRDPLNTYIFQGQPQLEVNIKIPVDISRLRAASRIAKHWDEIFYSMQLDRVIKDGNDDLWILEYKSAKIIQTHFYATDPQCSRYVWGANCVYDQQVAGVIYQQHRKQLPKEARKLLSGDISVAAQATSRAFYKKGLLEAYGEMSKVPAANITFLNQLAAQENEDYDDFIRRDRLYRNKASCETEAQKILLEISDMLDPELSIYPNPTRECANMCSFMTPCVALDDGSDYEAILKDLYEKRPEGYDGWRPSLPNPAEFKGFKL